MPSNELAAAAVTTVEAAVVAAVAAVAPGHAHLSFEAQQRHAKRTKRVKTPVELHATSNTHNMFYSATQAHSRLLHVPIS